MFEFKEFVGVTVDFGAGGGGEADEESVKVFKQGLVFFVDAAVGFIDDDKVKVTGAKETGFFVHPIDGIEQGGIGGQHHISSVSVFAVFSEIDRDDAGKVGLEGAEGLSQEGVAIGEEEDALDPVGAAENIDQGNRHTGFTGTGGHDQERFTGAFLVKVFGDALEGFDLIDTACNV